jgi:hypothetical protein
MISPYRVSLIVPSDFGNSCKGITINLFSNILDIIDYSPKHLMQIFDAIQLHESYFVCVSPYIDDIKTHKIEMLQKHFCDNYASFHLIQDVTNTKCDDFWTYINTFKHGYINHGGYTNCHHNNGTACDNRWTRVLRVFSA